MMTSSSKPQHTSPLIRCVVTFSNKLCLQPSSWSWGCWATWRSSPLWAPWLRTSCCRPSPAPPSFSCSPQSSSQVDQNVIKIKMRRRLLSGKAYLSDPIFCYRNTDDKFPKDMLTTYCYIHGTYTISQEYPVSHFKGKFVFKSNPVLSKIN